MEENLTQCVLFSGIFQKPVVARFDQENGSSDGGAILLKAADRRLGLIGRLAACLPDARQQSKIDHEIIELLSQRVYGIACGYCDANDAARLVEDPVHKMLVGRDAIEGTALASQPTLSRFENSPGPRVLHQMGEALVDAVVDRHKKRLRGKVRRLTLDLDPTADPTHGAQQLSFFNGHYDTACYLPLLAFVTFNGEPEQYLLTALLRPGNAPDKLGAVALLKRLITKLIDAFPSARILVRLDGGFACPEVMRFFSSDCCVDYVIGLPKNSILKRRAKKWMRKARRLSRKSDRTEHVYSETRYAAQTWDEQRRVVIKAEVVRNPDRDPKDNPRFLVTNLTGPPRQVYEQTYCHRGEIENRIKELHDLGIGRTSCSDFWANQFRVLLTAAAFVLMQGENGTSHPSPIFLCTAKPEALPRPVTTSKTPHTHWRRSRHSPAVRKNGNGWDVPFRAQLWVQ